MKNNKSEKQDVVGFNFEIIPLSQAMPLVIAGEGNYSDLKAKLLEVIPTLKEDQAFSFALPDAKEELPEVVRRGICKVLNMTLKKGGLHWRVTYSGSKKVFLAVPKTEKGVAKAYTPLPKWNPAFAKEEQQVMALRKQGLNPKEIIEQTGLSKERVHYIIYQKFHRVALRKSKREGKWAHQNGNTAQTIR